MKPFSEYIKNTFSDYLEECLKFHISVEYKFRYPFNNTQLYESLIVESLLLTVGADVSGVLGIESALTAAA